MRKIQLFNVSPSLPPELELLEVLPYNMWWCWHSNAIDLFRRIDPKRWKDSRHNPLTFLEGISQKRLESLVDDDGFMSHYRTVEERFTDEIIKTDNGKIRTPSPDSIVYFSLEYGIHESLRIYSGGLGILAGDYLKSASDLNLPIVAVGLLYRCGYFQQYLSKDGWQQEACQENEIHHLPLKKVCVSGNTQLHVSVPLPDGVLKAAVWRIDVGRVPLYLLDTNIADNPQAYREITTHLYDPDREVRLRQELLLGVGGFQALIKLGYNAPVCHMNEGHAAFVTLARISHLVKTKGLSPEVAQEIVRRTGVFTTHTPVPAGNESFAVDLVTPHLAALKKTLGIDTAPAITWGQPPANDSTGEINMTNLALSMSRFANGVSKLHGDVSRRMWSHLWPELPQDEIPIQHVTNGIHVASWLLSSHATLFDRHLGPEWRTNPADPEILARIDDIPNDELWRSHELGRSRLVRTAREFGEQQLVARSATQAEVSLVRSVLQHDVLTIGFARRFASYKRATLLLSDPERLETLLLNRETPIQMVFAGKAHPADDTGKSFIREIVQFAQRPGISGKMIFLENYDIRIARDLIQGVDVWLNTPRRPQEASGTSGMKAAVNGGLHLSVLDGWWDEGYSPDRGWAIGHGEEYSNEDHQDAVEAQALYNLLEDEIIPKFYDRSDSRTPGAWTGMMKESIKMSLAFFTSHRMVNEYENLLYEPAAAQHAALKADNYKQAMNLVDQHHKFAGQWAGLSISTPETDRDISALHVGDCFEVTAEVHLNGLDPDDLDVEVYFGPVNSKNEIVRSNVKQMQLSENRGNGECIFTQKVECEETGSYGMTVRLTPRGDDWAGIIPGFITWAN